MNSRDITVAATFGSLYALGVILLAPISFDLFQIRLADMLLPLTILFGWPAIIGVTLGTGVANFYGTAIGVGFGPVDIVGGSLANLLGCGLAYLVALRLRGFNWTGVLFVGTCIINAAVTLIVGTYLAFLIGIPLLVGWLGVFLGSLVAINIAGMILGALAYVGVRADPQTRRLLKISFDGNADAR